jgi:hypothetical protein
MPPPASKNTFLGAGAPGNAFLGMGDGMTHPYKWFHAKKITISYNLG